MLSRAFKTPSRCLYKTVSRRLGRRKIVTLKTCENVFKTCLENFFKTSSRPANVCWVYYEYFLKHYKLIAIDLSKQIELENLDLKQQITFIERLERNEGAAIFFIIEKSEEKSFEFTQNDATDI